MALEVAGSVQQFLAEVDSSEKPLPDYLSPPVPKAPEGGEFTEAQKQGGRAEVWPWQFSRPNMFERRSAWGLYWAEMFSGTRADGIQVHIPDADGIDAEIIAYWIGRAHASRHPVLRSRYADLVWELGNYLRKKGKANGDASLASIRPPIEVVRIAIDAYLEIVGRSLFEENSDAWKYINRAIELAKSVGDAERLRASRTALLGFRDTVRAVDPHKGQTWRFYEIAAKHFADDLSAADKDQIIADLRTELEATSDISNPNTFDPHASTNTADRLRFWELSAGIANAGRDAAAKAGAAFEQIAEKASGLVAVAWLEKQLARYRDAGDAASAARVEAAIRRRAADARAEMKSYPVEIKVPRAELEQLAERICGSTLEDALVNVAGSAIMSYDNIADRLKDSLKDSALIAHISATLTGPEGFTEATLGSMDDDEEGRTVHHAREMLHLHAGMLHRFFERIKDKYAPTAAQLADYIESSTWFGADRRPLLERGLQAWLDGDAVVAAHLLVPQLEGALRRFCTTVGGSVMTPDERYDGFRVNGMGTVLHEPHLVAAMPPEIRFHLSALFTDPRGLSVRNHIAHGMALPESLGIGLCNWIVHAVLMLALLRPSKCAPPSKAT